MRPSLCRSSNMMARSFTPRSQPKAPRSSAWPGSAREASSSAWLPNLSRTLALMDELPFLFGFCYALQFGLPLLHGHDLPLERAVHQLRCRDPFVGLADGVPQFQFAVGMDDDAFPGPGGGDVELLPRRSRERGAR